MQLIQLLRRNKDFSFILLATLLSGIGTALTIIAVYGELSDNQVNPIFYSFAFVLSLLPGLFTSFLAARMSNKLKISTALIVSEICGAIFLMLPMFGFAKKILWLLLVALFITSAINGFQAPIYQSLIRRKFNNEELKLVSLCSVYLFSANFIFGEALGIILYPLLGTRIYLCVDFFSYLAAVLLIIAAYKINKNIFNPIPITAEQKVTFKWNRFTVVQKRAFILNPLLALCCAPAMSLLPAIGAQNGKTFYVGGLVLAPALIFLLFKTLGQMIGPFVVNRVHFDKIFSSNTIIAVLLFFYGALYSLIYTTRNLAIACLGIVLAHIASNIVYILASYSFTKNFDEHSIAVVSAKHYQINIIIICLSGIWAGLVAEKFSFISVIYISLFFVVLTFFNLVKQSFKKENKYYESSIV